MGEWVRVPGVSPGRRGLADASPGAGAGLRRRRRLSRGGRVLWPRWTPSPRLREGWGELGLRRACPGSRECGKQRLQRPAGGWAVKRTGAVA